MSLTFPPKHKQNYSDRERDKSWRKEEDKRKTEREYKRERDTERKRA